MPIKLTKTGDHLVLHFSKLESEQFQECLSVVRSMPGRKFDGETKNWLFPAEPLIGMKLLHMLKPEVTPEFQAWFKSAKAESAEKVITDIQGDAKLALTWADRLRPYQRAAVAALSKRKLAILADDMGLGKTVQSIATVEEAAEEGSAVLIVCPNSVKRKWAREIEMWTGSTQITIIDGKTPAKRKQQLDTAAKFGHWVIVNWEKLRIMPDLQKVKWGAVIADEAHRAKNRKAKQTKALWKIKAPIQLALTGTPIQNSPDELWSLLKWLEPKTYTSYWRFFNDYVDYYEGTFGKIITGVKNADVLRAELSDKMIRRTKDQVLDLPPLTKTIIEVELGPEQRKIYDDVLTKLWVEIKAAAREGDPHAARMLKDPIYFIENGAARTTRLRQACSTPALLGGIDKSAKIDAAIDIITDADPDKKFVVFTEFKGTAEIVMERLLKHGVDADYIHGDVSQTDRDRIVEEMQEGELQVLCMTRDTGGEGIDLFAADTAIFIERHWTPARNEQAEARLHRMGQTNPVQIFIIVASDTIDDGKVLPTNARKETIVREIL